MEVERVQAIASKTLDAIPSEFIRSETEQPATTTVHGTVLQVPTIDLGGGDEDELVRVISKAGNEWGLFQVVNHGIPDEVIGNLQRVGKEFFELPQQEKEVYAKPQGHDKEEGYGAQPPKEIEGKKAWVDHLFHSIWPPSAINYSVWPSNPPSYRYMYYVYKNSCLIFYSCVFVLSYIQSFLCT